MPRFFEPTPAFFAWAKKFLRNSFVFEVGAGDGHTSEGLREIGIAGIGLDLCPEGKTIRGDGTCYPFIAATTVMLCRPCHGDFVASHAWNGGKKLTEEQVSWLKSHGHEIDPWMLANPLADDKARAAQYIQHAEELTGKKIKKTYDGD